MLKTEGFEKKQDHLPYKINNVRHINVVKRVLKCQVSKEGSEIIFVYAQRSK